jgi:hypothetical protein
MKSKETDYRKYISSNNSVAAIVMALFVTGLFNSKTQAQSGTINAQATLTVIASPNISGNAGTWQVVEQTTSSTHASGGLEAVQFSLVSSGGISITSSLLQLPGAFDTDSLTGNGFVLYRSSGNLVGGQVIDIRTSQSTNYSVNPAGDVYNIYGGVGDQAETVNTSDDGSGDGGLGDAPGNINGTRTFALPVLIASGAYSNSGAGGTISIFDGPLDLPQIVLLPVPMPPADGNTFQERTPNGLVIQNANIPAVPEPTSVAILTISSLTFLQRRRRIRLR